MSRNRNGQPSPDLEPRRVAPGEGEAVWFTNNRMTLKATAETTGGAYGLVEALAPAGSGPPLHVHHREDETFWVLEGTLTVRCGERTFGAGPGSYVFLPRGIPHTFVVEGDSPARIVSISTPGRPRALLRRRRPAGRGRRPPAGRAARRGHARPRRSRLRRRDLGPAAHCGSDLIR